MLGARVVYIEIMRPFAETALFRWVDGLEVLKELTVVFAKPVKNSWSLSRINAKGTKNVHMFGWV